MELPADVRDLTAGASDANTLLGVLVVMMGVSLVLGVVSAGIAIGVELGSLAIGVVAALVGLLLVVVPVAAFVLGSSVGGERTRDAAGRTDPEARTDPEPRADAPVAALRSRYLNDEIDEATFERRLDELLADSDAPESGTDAVSRRRTSDRIPDEER